MSVSNVSSSPRRIDTPRDLPTARDLPKSGKDQSPAARYAQERNRSSFETRARPLVALSVPAGAGAAPAKALDAKSGGGGAVMTPEQAFICQFTDPKWNPTGPNSSANCGPSSLAMTMAYMGRMPPGLSKEQQVDYARALMCPGRSGEFTYVKDGNGNSVPQLDRDHEYTDGDMEANGIRAAGGNPQFQEGWDALDRALANGPVISNGYTDQAWRNQFPERMGSGDVGHINAILGKTADGRYLVCDPLHTGGPVAMTRDQLSVFYAQNGGVPQFAATNFGSAGPVPTPGGTPSTGGTTGAGDVPGTDLQYDGGTNYNPEVEKLQHALVKAGYLTQAEMDTGPGYYGNRTKAAVARLQAEAGIDDDGTHFGPKTRAALTEKLSGTSGSNDPGSVNGPGSVGGTQLSQSDAQTAQRIDQMLAQKYPDSRMQGMGAVLVDACRKEHIPIDLALAQLGKESTFLRSDNNLSVANNNAGNLRFADWESQFGGEPGAGNFTHFPSVEQGLRAYVHLLGMPLYRNDVDNRDWASLVHKYAPSSDGNNEAEYAQQLTDWTKYFAGQIGVDSNWVNEQ